MEPHYSLLSAAMSLQTREPDACSLPRRVLISNRPSSTMSVNTAPDKLLRYLSVFNHTKTTSPSAANAST
jgi:hypothetical protein